VSPQDCHQKGSSFNAHTKAQPQGLVIHKTTMQSARSALCPKCREDALPARKYQVWRIGQTRRTRSVPGYVACLIQTSFFLELGAIEPCRGSQNEAEIVTEN